MFQQLCIGCFENPLYINMDMVLIFMMILRNCTHSNVLQVVRVSIFCVFNVIFGTHAHKLSGCKIVR